MNEFLTSYSKIRNTIVLKRGLLLLAPLFCFVYFLLQLVIFKDSDITSMYFVIEAIFISVVFGVLNEMIFFNISYSKRKCQEAYKMIEVFKSKYTSEEQVVICMFLIYTQSDNVNSLPVEKWEKFLKRMRLPKRISKDLLTHLN